MSRVMLSDHEIRIPTMAKKYRLSEFLICLIMFSCGLFLHWSKAVSRDIPRVVVQISDDQIVYARDPTIDLKQKPEQVSNFLLIVLAYGVPMIAHGLMVTCGKLNRVRQIPHDTRDFILSLLISAGLAFISTTFIKNLTGRMRPSFYDMCGWDTSIAWDGKMNLCTLPAFEKEARKSFPSGHSSSAFSGLFLLTLYLLGRSRLVARHRLASPIRSSKRLLKLFLCFAPSFLAAWIAITRSIDNWHHFSDILAGSLIGVASATMAYAYNYAAIFSSEAAGLPLEAYYAKKDENASSSRQHQHQHQHHCLHQQRQDSTDMETSGSMVLFGPEDESNPYASITSPPIEDIMIIDRSSASANSCLTTNHPPPHPGV